MSAPYYAIGVALYQAISGKVISLFKIVSEKQKKAVSLKANRRSPFCYTLIICEFAPVGEGWTWNKRSDEGLFVTITSGDPDAEALQKGTDLTFEVHCSNIQTGEKETSTVTVTLPAMTMQEGHK